MTKIDSENLDYLKRHFISNPKDSYQAEWHGTIPRLCLSPDSPQFPKHPKEQKLSQRRVLLPSEYHQPFYYIKNYPKDLELGFDPDKIIDAHRRFCQESKPKFGYTQIDMAQGKTPTAYTYDDIILRPGVLSNESRMAPECHFSTMLTRNRIVPNPLLPANMATVFSMEMAGVLIKQNPDIILISDRFPIETGKRKQKDRHPELTKEWKDAMTGRVKKYPSNIFLSLGTKAYKEDKQTYLSAIKELVVSGASGFCIDIAKGSNLTAFDLLSKIKKINKNVEVIIGNIATLEEYIACVKAGADAVKVGIGPGNQCTTRIMTGHGLPMVSALTEIYSARLLYGVPIIADGGAKTPGDIVKAIACGADTVMCGSIFSEATEAGAFSREELEKIKVASSDTILKQIITDLLEEQPSEEHRLYVGQASELFQRYYYGIEPATPEGRYTWKKSKYSITHIYEEYLGGLMSALSYSDVVDLNGLKLFGQLVLQTSNGLVEANTR